MQSKYFAHQTPQSKTIFVVFEILGLFSSTELSQLQWQREIPRFSTVRVRFLI